MHTAVHVSSHRTSLDSLSRARDSVPQPKVGVKRLAWNERSMIERPPSPQPSPPREGARWAGLELSVSCSPRTHLLEIPGECLDATSAAISVQAFQDALFAPPLLGERAGVRADQCLIFPAATNSHRPGIARQRMRRPFLKLTKDGISNHLRCASQPRVPEPEFLYVECRKILGPFFVMLALFRKTMLRAIEFNREPRLFTEKIV